MKREELEALQLTKEQVDKVLDMHHAELDPVQKELETTKSSLSVAEGKVSTQKTTIEGLKADLKKFDGVDVTALNDKIEQLEKDLQTKDSEHAQQIADRDFQDNVKTVIAKYKGRNEKAIKALLDMETLKASKNQNEDLDKAVQALTEAEDSKMLFGTEEEGESLGEGDIPGTVKKGSSGDAWLSQMMAAAGVAESDKT